MTKFFGKKMHFYITFFEKSPNLGLKIRKNEKNLRFRERVDRHPSSGE
jgi:hypothetical protein